MANQQESREGARAAWVGVLAAFKEAIDETIDELRDRGDVTPERAKETVRGSMRRAQQAMEGVRGRVEFVPRREFDALRQQMAELQQRVAELEAAAGGTGAGDTGAGESAAGETGSGDRIPPASS